MRKFFKWLLSAVVFTGAIGFGGIDYSYAGEQQVVTYSDDYVCEDDESIVDYVNQKFMAHEEKFIVRVYESQYEPHALVDVIQEADCYYELLRKHYQLQPVQHLTVLL